MNQLFASAGLILLFASSTYCKGTSADLILHSGKIVTVDKHFTICQALAVKDGRLLKVGSNKEALASRGPETEVVDLAGRVVLPGLIDSHVHPIGASEIELDHEIPSMESIGDVLEYIRGRAKVVSAGEWIVLRQAFITRLREQRFPTRAELDEAAPRNPVAFITGPDAAANSLAFEKSGIDPAGDYVWLLKDPQTGQASGIVRGAAHLKITEHDRKSTNKQRADSLAKLVADYNRVGITSIIDRACDPDDMYQFQHLQQENRLRVRTALSRLVKSDSTEGAIAEIDAIAKEPLFHGGDDRLWIVGVKTFLDGGMLTGSAYMREPWGVSAIYGIDDPNYRGMRYIAHDRLVPLVRACVERNLAFTAHAVGDGAVYGLLDAYEEVDQILPVAPTHSSISHSNFMSAEAVARAARLHILLDIQPAWLYLDSRTLVAQFGYDRLRYFQPLRSLFDAGVVAGGGSDHMQKIGSLRSINPYDPWLGIWVTMTRKARWYEGEVHPEEALSRERAIRFYTINNAYLMKKEDRLGSLEPGKLADMIVVDRDVLTCPIDAFRETRVLATYLGGAKVSP